MGIGYQGIRGLPRGDWWSIGRRYVCVDVCETMGENSYLLISSRTLYIPIPSTLTRLVHV